MLSGAEPTSLKQSVLGALAPVRRSPQTQRRVGRGTSSLMVPLCEATPPFETSFITLFGQK